MVYVPVVMATSNISTNFYKNIYRLVDEYKVANSSVAIQDQVVNASYPLYTIYMPELDASGRDFSSTSKKRTMSVQIDFDATETQGWKKTSEMFDQLEAGVETENANLKTARLRYLGTTILDSTPLDINGQQIFSYSVLMEFEVLL